MVKLTTVSDVLNAVDDAVLVARDKHGYEPYSSSHEAYGIIAEEMHELMLAIHANDDEQIKKELLDVAQAAVFALASMETK